MWFYSDALPHLAETVNRQEARSTAEDAAATENAISAVAKILKHNSSLIDANAVECFLITSVLSFFFFEE